MKWYRVHHIVEELGSRGYSSVSTHNPNVFVLKRRGEMPVELPASAILPEPLVRHVLSTAESEVQNILDSVARRAESEARAPVGEVEIDESAVLSSNGEIEVDVSKMIPGVLYPVEYVGATYYVQTSDRDLIRLFRYGKP